MNTKYDIKPTLPVDYSHTVTDSDLTGIVLAAVIFAVCAITFLITYNKR